MRIKLPSTIIEAALHKGSLSIEANEAHILRELNEGISPIMEDKEPSAGNSKSKVSKEDREELEEIASQLHKASDMHKGQAERLERLIEYASSDDELSAQDVLDMDNSHRSYEDFFDISVLDEEEDDLASYKNRKKAFEELSDRIQKALEKKVKDHKEEVGTDKRKQTDKFILAVCFHRGVGAYHTNPSSVRPSVSSPEQWALARVNGFLYALENLKFKDKPYDTDLLPVDHPLSTREASQRAVGDTDPTNFPKAGEDEAVSLRNSEYPLFDRRFAARIKEDYPVIWDMGGNIKGNQQYTRLTKILDNDGKIQTSTDEEAVRLREAWAARHKEDYRLAGTVAQIKWLVIGSKGEAYMKELINDEIKKRELAQPNGQEPRSQEIKKIEVTMDNKEMELRCIGENLRQDGSRLFTLEGNKKLSLSVRDVDVRAFDENDQEIDVEESLRAINGRGRPAKYYSIEGIASSTSVDSYGTEMSYDALMEMQHQMQAGVPLLPRHSSRENGQMAEWNEVIGRTYDASLMQQDVAAPADRKEKHYTLLVRSRLYGEDAISRELVKRLRRGEPIGQSIGGWFNKLDVIENSQGEVERVIVRSVQLDHLAITRAPANPDSVGLATYAKDSTTLSNIINEWRSKMKPEDTTDPTASVGEEEKNPRAFTAENIEAAIPKVEAPEERNEDTAIDKGVLSEIVEEVMRTKIKGEAHTGDLSKPDEKAILTEAIAGLVKDANEKRHICDVVENEETGEIMVTFKKEHDSDMMEMGHHEKMTEEYMKEYMKGEGGKMLLMLIEEKMKEYIENMGKMEWDHLEKSEAKTELSDPAAPEERDLDHSAVVDEPVEDDEDPNGGDDMEVADPNSIDDQFDHLQYRKVMRFDDAIPLAAEDVPWSWNTTSQDEVLGKGLDNWERYAKAHFYMDSEANAETKGAYKLPFCLMINGELRVVLKGLQAVMAVLNGARGGVDITDDEREAVYMELTKYMKKFGLEAPELRERTTEEASKPEIKSEKTTQNITEGVILEKETSSQNSMEDRAMNEENLKALAALIQSTVKGAVEPVLARVEAIEARAVETVTEKPAPKAEPKIEELPSDVVELRAMLKSTQEMLARTMQEPIRVGRHQTAMLTRGVGAESALGQLAERSAAAGQVGLASIVTKHIKELSEETELSKLSVHNIKELLSAGLRAAEHDGLLAKPDQSWS